MNPAVIIGAIPAFWLSLVLTLASTGICESKSTKSGECRFEWAMTFTVLGLAGTIKAALGIFDAGYKTWNPDLHQSSAIAKREEERNEAEPEKEETEPDPEPETEPEVVPAAQEFAAERNAVEEVSAKSEEELARESLIERMEKAYEEKVQGKNKRRAG
jgi:hypothetical protein